MCYRLGEVHFDATIIDENIVHLEVSLLARLVIVKTDKGCKAWAAVRDMSSVVLADKCQSNPWNNVQLRSWLTELHGLLNPKCRKEETTTCHKRTIAKTVSRLEISDDCAIDNAPKSAEYDLQILLFWGLKRI